jgi:hypothetical protein
VRDQHTEADEDDDGAEDRDPDAAARAAEVEDPRAARGRRGL